jgi:hypothetical protein
MVPLSVYPIGVETANRPFERAKIGVNLLVPPVVFNIHCSEVPEMKTLIAASIIVLLLIPAAPVRALEVSTRPGDSILGGSAGLSAVRLDTDEERIQSVQIALRGAHFLSERWALGAGLFLDRTDQHSTDITTGRILAELLLVPIPDANVSPFLRVGGGA